MERHDPDLAADELTTLGQYMDFHRATFLQKIEGLTQEQLATRSVGSSELTLGGLAKHLALNEDSWFGEVLTGTPMPEPWASAPFDDDPDWEWHSASDDSPDDLVAIYNAACERSRAHVAAVGDLDALSVELSRKENQKFSLRWILLHMIEETSRHNGHADLLREAIDGATGE
jgi:uncharacterized damage-inducible protein DinB